MVYTTGNVADALVTFWRDLLEGLPECVERLGAAACAEEILASDSWQDAANALQWDQMRPDDEKLPLIRGYLAQ